MAELKRIAGLSNDLYDGRPWIDVNIIETLNAIDAEKAASKPGSDWNSIWQIVNHMISWRDHIMQNLTGAKLTSPADNYFRAVPDTSSAAWQSTLKKFGYSQKQWLEFLQQSGEDILNSTMEGHSFDNYKYIHGVIQHDAYHLGQIAMLAKHA